MLKQSVRILKRSVGRAALAVAIAALIVSGCSAPPTATPGALPAAGSPVVDPTPIGQPVPRTAAAPTPTRIATGGAVQIPLFLTVLSPADESETNSRQSLVRGKTAPGAVVSVNGELADLSANGEFSRTISLEEGANAIEIIASDVEGSVVRKTLLLLFSP